MKFMTFCVKVNTISTVRKISKTILLSISIIQWVYANSLSESQNRSITPRFSSLCFTISYLLQGYRIYYKFMYTQQQSTYKTTMNLLNTTSVYAICFLTNLTFFVAKSCRVCKWAKSHQPFENGVHFKYLTVVCS